MQSLEPENSQTVYNLHRRKPEAEVGSIRENLTGSFDHYSPKQIVRANFFKKSCEKVIVFNLNANLFMLL